ncbi:MAG TPA: exonuclease SbcCD subunit D C-terminal domain-containing protein [Acidobacteriota bacterium]|nr:exonuclease SbcCD subunit D C-terminal domain-containing protein [Acidobacteriota bacterium]
MSKFRLLHTSDWHIGQVLHEQPREYEHQFFLDWLVSLLEAEQISALLVAGDIFDGPNPTAVSQQIFYKFLATAKTRLPHLEIVILGGNHDSAARLDAPHPVLSAFGVHVVGGLRRTEAGFLETDRCLVTLHGPDGNPAAYLAAVPYLRPGDLPLCPNDEDGDLRLVESISSIYRPICEEAINRAGADKAALAAGHLYLTGCQLSELSERKIQNGYLAALPADIFCTGLSYIALGHLHLAQSVTEKIHYSGSPLPLSFAESSYNHRVLIAEFDGPELVELRSIPVPRPVQMLRIPEDGPRPPEQVLKEIQQLESLEGRDPLSPTRPYLEVRVRLERPRPTLREEISRALDDKWPRLLKITPDYGPREHSLASSSPARGLDELNHEEIFRSCYRRKYVSADSILNEPSDELMAAFRCLWEEQERGEVQ